jgi:hypothetical protein
MLISWKKSSLATGAVNTLSLSEPVFPELHAGSVRKREKKKNK